MRWIFVLFLAACGGSVAPSSDDTPAVVDAGADADVCAEHVDLGAVWLCNRDIRTVLSDEALRLVRV